MTDEKQYNEMLRYLGILEQRMVDMIYPLQSLRSDGLLQRIEKLVHEPLKIDDRPVRNAFRQFEERLDKFEKIISASDFKHFESFMEAMKNTNMQEVYDMLKYQANRLKEIEKNLYILTNIPPERQIKVDISLDGNKQTIDLDNKFKSDEEENYILSKLPESHYVIFKEYFKDGRKNFFTSVAKIVKCSVSTVKIKWNQVLRACRKDKTLFTILLSQLKGDVKNYFKLLVTGD